MAATSADSSGCEDMVIVAKNELNSFLVRAMEKVGAMTSDAVALAELLVSADHRGHYSHGLNRLEYYMDDLKLNIVTSSAEMKPEVVKQTAATALVDGHNMFGPTVGKFAMDLAIRKAQEAGIGWVSVRGSNHFGIAGWYSIRAMEQGLLGLAFTNTSPKLVPTRARVQTLGTNPLSLAAPANNGDSLVLDMATTSVALGKVEMKKVLHQEVPQGWGVDENGQPTQDADKILSDWGGLYPLGGPETTSGYKGYGLSLMVEVFCGILSGSAYGHNIRQWQLHDGFADLGQCFVAIDPEAFAPGFTDRMSDLLDHLRALQPAEGETEVLVPGDPERRHAALCDRLGGVPYHLKQIQWADDLAKRHGVEPLVRLSP